jgi:hypothetical protein
VIPDLAGGDVLVKKGTVVDDRHETLGEPTAILRKLIPPGSDAR